ncbi:hypothetical protein [Streptomyces griseochromogenes]|uniref:hypothetical protein n=1 Tax=Streptomyces griseochromogenes TaxID=68214 RepID=UPI00379D5D94
MSSLPGQTNRRRRPTARGHQAISHGTLCPAIKRMEKAGLPRREAQPGIAAAPRHVPSLTEEGLDEPSSFFYRGDKPLAAAEVDDPFRQGVPLIARATSKAEKAWLDRTIAELECGA